MEATVDVALQSQRNIRLRKRLNHVQIFCVRFVSHKLQISGEFQLSPLFPLQVRSVVDSDKFRSFGKALLAYKTGGDNCFEVLMVLLLDVLGAPKLRYLLYGMRRYLKNEHKEEFDIRLASLQAS